MSSYRACTRSGTSNACTEREEKKGKHPPTLLFSKVNTRAYVCTETHSEIVPTIEKVQDPKVVLLWSLYCCMHKIPHTKTRTIQAWVGGWVGAPGANNSMTEGLGDDAHRDKRPGEGPTLNWRWSTIFLYPPRLGNPGTCIHTLGKPKLGATKTRRDPAACPAL